MGAEERVGVQRVNASNAFYKAAWVQTSSGPYKRVDLYHEHTPSTPSFMQKEIAIRKYRELYLPL